MAPPDYWWVEPLIVGIGIAVSFGAAFYAVFTDRKTTRIKATLDLIEASESREHYLDLYSHYRKFRVDKQFKTLVLSPEPSDGGTARLRCFDFLNHYELVALGIKEGILDEDFYRGWMEYVVLRDYEEGRDLIVAARDDKDPNDPGNMVAYCELEKLCIKWGASPISAPGQLPAPTDC